MGPAVRIATEGLQCSSFLVMTYFRFRDDNILPKKELLLSPWVGCLATSSNPHPKPESPLPFLILGCSVAYVATFLWVSGLLFLPLSLKMIDR